jgi:type I restriction enzyme S subunit
MEDLKTVKLGGVCKFLNGGTPSKDISEYFDGNIAWITGADITSFKVTKARSFITEKAIKESATNLVPAGTVLLVTRTSVGKVAVAGIPLCFSQDITAIKNDEKYLDKGFLIYFLQTKVPYFKQKARGATIGGITREIVSEIEIPLPKPDEQKRIAAILDKADRLRRQRRFAQTLSDSFLQSVFIKMFGDPVSNPMNWDSCSVNELCSVIVDCPHTTPNYTEKTTHFACIRTSDIQDGLLDWASTKYVSEDEYKTRIARYKPVTGDVLYTREGERYGLAAQVPKFTTLCLGQRMMLLKADSKISNNEFLCALMNSPLIYRQAENLVSGSTSPHVNVGDIREFEAIKPPLPLQEKFAKISQKFERVRRQHREATRQAEHLFQTLLHRAFRGEL